MVKPKMKIVFDNPAKIALREAYNFIKKDSSQSAEKVRSEILRSIEELIKFPEKYPPDKYRLDNDISYRAFEIFNYRITYHVSPDEIKIIRIRHTKMNLLEY